MSWSSVTVVLKAKRMPFRRRNQSQQSLSSSCPRAWRSRTVFPEHILRVMLRNLDSENFCPVAQPGGRGGGGTPPPPRNWVHKKIPGCAVELNTQNCAWFGIQISLITAMSFREAIPRTTHQGLCLWTPLGTSVFQTPCVPTSKFLLRHCFCLFLHPPVRTM